MFMKNKMKETCMSLRIIYGRAGTGKSSLCFEEINKLITEENKIYIITPEQFSFTAEQRLLETVETSVVNAEVITFERIANRLLNTTRGLKKKILSNSAKQMLIYSVLLEEKKNLNFLGKSEENVELLFNTITELKKHNIHVNKLLDSIENIDENYLKLKLQDIYRIYFQYEEKIKSNYIDIDDLLTKITTILEESSMFKDAIIYIDEFVGFTPQEYQMIKILLRVAKSVTITICSDNIENRAKGMFYSSNRTVAKLLEIADEEKVEIQNKIKLTKNYRF